MCGGTTVQTPGTAGGSGGPAGLRDRAGTARGRAEAEGRGGSADTTWNRGLK